MTAMLSVTRGITSATRIARFGLVAERIGLHLLTYFVIKRFATLFSKEFNLTMLTVAVIAQNISQLAHLICCTYCPLMTICAVVQDKLSLQCFYVRSAAGKEG